MICEEGICFADLTKAQCDDLEGYWYEGGDCSSPCSDANELCGGVQLPPPFDPVRGPFDVTEWSAYWEHELDRYALSEVTFDSLHRPYFRAKCDEGYIDDDRGPAYNCQAGGDYLNIYTLRDGEWQVLSFIDDIKEHYQSLCNPANPQSVTVTVWVDGGGGVKPSSLVFDQFGLAYTTLDARIWISTGSSGQSEDDDGLGDGGGSVLYRRFLLLYCNEPVSSSTYCEEWNVVEIPWPDDPNVPGWDAPNTIKDEYALEIPHSADLLSGPPALLLYDYRRQYWDPNAPPDPENTATCACCDAGNDEFPAYPHTHTIGSLYLFEPVLDGDELATEPYPVDAYQFTRLAGVLHKVTDDCVGLTTDPGYPPMVVTGLIGPTQERVTYLSWVQGFDGSGELPCAVARNRAWMWLGYHETATSPGRGYAIQSLPSDQKLCLTHDDPNDPNNCLQDNERPRPMPCNDAHPMAGLALGSNPAQLHIVASAQGDHVTGQAWHIQGQYCGSTDDCCAGFTRMAWTDAVGSNARTTYLSLLRTGSAQVRLHAFFSLYHPCSGPTEDYPYISNVHPSGERTHQLAYQRWDSIGGWEPHAIALYHPGQRCSTDLNEPFTGCGDPNCCGGDAFYHKASIDRDWLFVTFSRLEYNTLWKQDVDLYEHRTLIYSWDDGDTWDFAIPATFRYREDGRIHWVGTSSVLSPRDGTFMNPWQNLQEALTRVNEGGTVALKLRSGAYAAPSGGVINGPARLIAPGGPVTIGQ